jgi:hypothetical protein
MPDMGAKLTAGGRKENVRSRACCAEKHILRLPPLVGRFGPVRIRGF